MATTRKQGATDQTQDAANNQQDNHAQTPDQSAANSGAFAQSAYQNTQQQSGTYTGGQENAGSEGRSGNEAGGSVVDTAVQAGKKWLDDSGVLKNANQLPQAAKEWGTKALGSVSALSTTQKVVGGALLLAGAAYLTTRGKSKSKKSDNTDYRAGNKSEGYRQGAWAGYAGGKSASRRNTESGSRSDVSSYGTERRATGSSYGRGAGSSDTDFGSGRQADSGNRDSNARSQTGGQGSYRSGSTYSSSGSGSYSSGRDSGSSASAPSSSSVGNGRNAGSSPNSSEQDYDTSF